MAKGVIHYICLTAILPLALCAGRGHAGSHLRYKDKTVRIIVGSPPGGMLDTYSRAISRHMGKHLPGHPVIVIENKPGAGTLLAANYLYKAVKPDGLTFGTFIGNVLLAQVLGEKGIEFDAPRFAWIGAAQKATAVCILTKASGITSLEKWQTSARPVKLGGTGAGSNTDDIPKILAATLGLPIHLVSGYKGSAAIRQAAESGEVDGLCASWEILRVAWSRALSSGDVRVVVQVTARAHPDLPRVPLAIDMAKTDEARQLIQAGVHDPAAIIQPYAAPPGMGKDEIRILRKAFLDTMKDKEFLAETEKSRLAIDPTSGEGVETIIAGLFKLDPGLVTRLKETLK